MPEPFAPNILAEAQLLDDEAWTRRVMLATVVGASGNLVQVQPNSPGADAKFYTRLEGPWSTIAGDVVVLIDTSGHGGWVVFGKIGGLVP
jgi:hypothetical protein